MKKLITPKETAARLSVSIRTVSRYEKQGLLTAIRLSRRCVRYDEAEIEKAVRTYAGGSHLPDATGRTRTPVQ